MYKWTNLGQYTTAPDKHTVEFYTNNSIAGYLIFQDGSPQEYGPNGITNEELIDVLIDRISTLNQPPYGCQENLDAIAYLSTAKRRLQDRTKDRTRRGIEGTLTP
jgi:hypothetical protein